MKVGSIIGSFVLPVVTVYCRLKVMFLVYVVGGSRAERAVSL